MATIFNLKYDWRSSSIVRHADAASVQSQYMECMACDQRYDL